MKRIICNTCRKEVEPNLYGFAPTGWLTVNRRTEGPYREPEDYCSNPCAVTGIPANTPPVSDVEATIEETERAPRMTLEEAASC